MTYFIMHITHSNTLFIVDNTVHVIKTDEKLFVHNLFTYFFYIYFIYFSQNILHLFVFYKIMHIRKYLKVYFSKFYLVHFTFLQGMLL